MSWYHRARRTFLKQRLAVKEAQLAAMDEARLAFAENSEIESYTFDSGAARQTVKRRSDASIQLTIDQLEKEIMAIKRKLNFGGLVNVQLRRG